MERRTFVQATAATLGAAALGQARESKPASSELFELRTFTVKPTMRPLVDDYLAKAYIPALRRLGLGPVGAFAEAPEKVAQKLADAPVEVQRLTVLIVHSGAETIATLPARLAADAEYLKAAEAYLAAKPGDPAYLRIESSLLAAIGGMPRLEKPDAAKRGLFNLRVYESHNERAAAKKVEMFETGEIAIFKRVGLTPVFFASALAGAAMPNLTYLLAFADEAARKAAWSKFVGDPEWVKLKSIPGYGDKEIVSKITNRILTPTAYSEI